ncbi:hypothetical protein [Micromonospora zhanjiangensis]|uniref:Uncharacterized protein n=1 Tax=Micromonospora zhanjiangensis TaxID=1522057 RepID=A0ABV8KMS2_9ACTN
MQAKQELTDLIRAMARQDWGTIDQLLAELDRLGWAGGSQVLSAAFYVAVTRRFSPDTDVRAITAYVADVRSRYQDGKSLPAMDLEAMIRAALGEADLIDNLAPEAAFSAQLALLSALLDDLNLDEPQLESFIQETERTAAEYM